MSRKSVYFISVGGVDITGAFNEKATDISVTDSSGETADTASITLADDNGQIAFPQIGAPISIGIGWGVPVLLFEGFVDDVSSKGDRGGGRSMTISAKSADTVKGKTKEQFEKHKDDATLGDVAKEWGQAAGLSEVFVHADLASIQRPYWSMNNESFPAWGERIAKSLGATFKILGGRAVMVPRSAGVSANGQPLVPITATWGGNLISWDIKPALGRPQHKKFRTRRYDRDEGEWKADEEEASYETESDATMTVRYPEPDEDGAKSRAKSAEKETDRERGGGSAEIDGNPAAQAEATCIIVGARPGVDGPYRIDSVTHKRSRGGGFTSSLTLKQPGEGTGKDERA